MGFWVWGLRFGVGVLGFGALGMGHGIRGLEFRGLKFRFYGSIQFFLSRVGKRGLEETLARRSASSGSIMHGCRVVTRRLCGVWVGNLVVKS